MILQRKIAAVIVCLLIVIGLSACGPKGRVAKDSSRYIREHELSRLPKFDIPVEMNDRVVAWMEYFQGSGQGHFRRYMERSGRYIPLMQKILKEEGMPRDLVYIAMIESGFNTQARSHASAVGPWQFIRSTGVRYGLTINRHVDERRDPYKSTKAAAQYFRDLYAEFGDWYLAMAGYNAGEGRVGRALRSTGTRNFWNLADDRRALRPETRDYVPKFIAAAIISKMPERFGFADVKYKEAFDYDVGTAKTQTDLAVIAKCAGVSEDDIFDLNPHLISGTTPPGIRNYEIRIPKGAKGFYAEQYALLSEDERIQMTKYRVRRGDTIFKIAKRFGVQSDVLAEVNGLRLSKSALHRGMVINIPAGKTRVMYESYAQDDSAPRGKERAIHKVRKGETLGGIARRYGVSVAQLKDWNGIKKSHSVHKGTKLVVYKKPSKENLFVEQKEVAGKMHKIKSGETIATIARLYGVTTKQILELNGIANPKQVRSGQTIVIRKKTVNQKAESVTSLSDNMSTEILKTPNESLEVASEHNSTLVKLAEVDNSGMIYTVKNGDTLWDIARRYKVTIAELQKWNNLKEPSAVKPGTTITIRK